MGTSPVSSPPCCLPLASTSLPLRPTSPLATSAAAHTSSPVLRRAAPRLSLAKRPAGCEPGAPCDIAKAQLTGKLCQAFTQVGCATPYLLHRPHAGTH